MIDRLRWSHRGPPLDLWPTGHGSSQASRMSENFEFSLAPAFRHYVDPGLPSPSGPGRNSVTWPHAHELHRDSQAAWRSNSHAAKHRIWTWYLSRPGLSPLRWNWISNSISVARTGRSQIAHGAPTPGPPHVRSGVRLGSLPLSITARAFSRRVSSSIWLFLGCLSKRPSQMPRGSFERPVEGVCRLSAPFRSGHPRPKT